MVNIKSKADAAFIFAALKAQYRLSLILFIVLILFTSPIANAADLAKMSVIRRDEYGVPHIVADTEEAAAFAQGYATAEDHFAELSRLFLRARGEQAAVFGEKYAAEDILVHKLGIWETAKSRFTDLPPSMQLILNAYTGGYNLYRAGHKDGGKVPE